MKMNERTLTVLKNFASINSGVVLRPGLVQKTVSAESTILVEAHLEDDFTETFGIYDLNQFLGNVTTLNSPELNFTSQSVIMKDADLELNFYSASPNLIISPPEGKDLVMKDADVSFNLTYATLQKLLRLASMNDLSNLSIIGKNGGIYLQAHESKNDTSNFASSKIADHDGADFSVMFKTENLKLIPDDYKVEIKIGGFTCWTNKTNTLKYFIALEKK
jgi:hypothetical protein